MQTMTILPVAAGLHPSERVGMDGVRDLLEKLLAAGLFEKCLRGVFHVAIGRRITLADDTLISTGLTWRALANILKDMKIHPDVVKQLGVDPDDLSPREKPRFWYSAIALSKPDSPLARGEADTVVATLRAMGYVVGPAPLPSTTLSTPPPPPSSTKPKTDASSAKKKKKS